jgi:hypothetical protein
MNEIAGFEEWFIAHNQKRLNAGFDDYRPAEKMLACVAWQAARAKPVVPDGYVLVPMEPTDEMIEAGRDSLGRGHGMFLIYESMIKAAPKQ